MTNIRLLTNEELKSFENKYQFKLIDNYISVSVVNFNRPTLHPIGKQFSLICNGRKITINPETIVLWKNDFPNLHLVYLQNLVNTLLVMYQTPKKEDIEKLLN